MPRPPLPPFTAETAAQKARLAEDAWNSRDPARVALGYTVDSVWRNRAEFIHGREAIEAFLTRKWNRELDYRLIKEVWTYRDNRIAVRFAYEWHDDSGNWFRSYGNENWEFDEDGLMRRRLASINDLPIKDGERKYHWPLGRRPDGHPSLSELGPQGTIRLLLPVGRARNVGHRHAIVDGLAAHRFGLRLLLGRVEHFEHDVARNEADAGVVGHHQVARRAPNLPDLNRAVDLHGLDPPLAGDRRDVARPHRIVERAGMGDVAHAALHDRADLALAFAGLGGDAAHVRDVGHALDHQHVAFLREIVRLELRHAVDVLARAFDRIDALEDVAHGQRRPDDGLARDGRLEHRCADDAAGDAELVHRVREDPGAIAERDEALDRALGRARDRHQLDVFGRDAAGQPLLLCRVHGGAPDLKLAASRTLHPSRETKKERGEAQCPPYK